MKTTKDSPHQGHVWANKKPQRDPHLRNQLKKKNEPPHSPVGVGEPHALTSDEPITNTHTQSELGQSLGGVA